MRELFSTIHDNKMADPKSVIQAKNIPVI